ncbi:hypothetical protein O181_057304 [Austropuccinia psidii MF-1]|uniref:Uncharacterized protein n=1 Tax=Austropuccinia psidii MF-1 TaxID=1389203 RepID=A0A9Q3EA78_9BASI|nr:hypothetical protein [Austropuccinia psidii MF-1]
MSQYAEQSQKQFAELEASHERMKKLTASMDEMFRPLQEGHAQLSKASEETKKILKIVFEEQHLSRRDRDCLDKDINKLFNVYHNIKPQPQCHVMDNLYYQDDIKPDAIIPDYWITARLNTAFKVHASIWYTEMKEVHGRRNWPWWKSQIIQKYSNGTWIWQKTVSFENEKYSVDKDTYEWCLRQSKRLKAIDPQMNNKMRNHKLLTQMLGELDHVVKCRCNHKCTLDDIENTLKDVRRSTNIGKFTPYRSSSFKEKQPFRVMLKEKPKERVAEVA